MKKICFLKRAVASSLSLLLAVGSIHTPVLAAETSGVQVTFNVVQQITGDTPKEKAEFSYIIETDDADAPMPEPDEHIATITINDDGASAVSGDETSSQEEATAFASLKNLAGLEDAEGLLAGPATFKITYTEPGKYTYTIRQQKESLAEGYSHDDSIYNIEVNVQYDSYGKLEASYSAYKGKGKAKSAGIVFISDYEEPEPVTEPQTEPVTEPQTEPVTEPQTEPVTEPQTEPVTEPQTEPATEPQTEPVTEPQTEPVTEPQTEPVTEPQTEPVTEPVTEPQTEPVTEPVTEPQTEPTTEPQTEKTKVSVSFDKVDADTGAKVSGAVLRVINANGATVDQWTTDGSTHVISDKLIDGESYRLIEINAPTGYQFAKDVSFTAAQDVNVVMADEAKPKDQKQTASVTVTKQLTCSGNVIGAKDQIFYVALYEDQACTYRISEIKTLEFKMASSVSVTFDGLEPNKTYYLGEADVNGVNLVSGKVADGTLFVTDFIQGQAVTASTQAGAATLKFLNEFQEIPQNFYREGELVITKEVVDAEGNAAETDETFYAGIFADPQFTTLSDQVTSNIVALHLSAASEASTTVAVILPDSGTLHLYVTEVDASGIPVSQNENFGYEVSVDESDVSMDMQNEYASVTITNQIIDDSEPDSEPDQKETTSTGTTPSTGSTTTAAKTGDDTPTEIYMILLAVSAIFLVIGVERRRRRRA